MSFLKDNPELMHELAVRGTARWIKNYLPIYFKGTSIDDIEEYLGEIASPRDPKDPTCRYDHTEYGIWLVLRDLAYEEIEEEEKDYMATLIDNEMDRQAYDS